MASTASKIRSDLARVRAVEPVDTQCCVPGQARGRESPRCDSRARGRARSRLIALESALDHVRFEGCQSPCPHCDGSRLRSGAANLMPGVRKHEKSDSMSRRSGARAERAAIPRSRRSAVRGSLDATTSIELVRTPGELAAAAKLGAAAWKRARVRPAARAWSRHLNGYHEGSSR